MATLSSVRVAAYTRVLLKDDRFVNALLVYLAALASFAAMPFFPLITIPFVALIPAVVTYGHKPEYGVLTLAVLNMLPALYQSTSFGYIYMLAMSVIFFKVWTSWREIAFLHIIIFMPFAIWPFSYLGGLVYLAMFIASLSLGSLRATSLSVPSVLLVLLLSSVWQVPNSAYLPLHLSYYQTDPSLIRSSVPGIVDFFTMALPNSLGNLFNAQGLMQLSEMLGIMWNNLLIILLNDSGLIQIIFWSALLYIAPYLTVTFRGAKGERAVALSLFTIPIFYFGIYLMMDMPYPWEMLILTAIDYALFYYISLKDYTFSRERAVRHEKAMKNLDIPCQDLSIMSNLRGLDDVANYEDVKAELISAIKSPLAHPEIAVEYNLKPPKGLLLFGPPGTGKTYLMKALAKELGYMFCYVKTSDILSPYYGESEKMVSKIFDFARKNSPVILFFDEIDAIGKKRGSGMDDVTPRVLNTLLQELDGVVSKKPIIFVAATNVPNLLDKALMRPGRIDKIIYMGLPDKKGRELLFRYYLGKLAKNGIVAPKINYKKLAEMTERFSPADIANVVQEAKTESAQRALQSGQIEPITMEDLTNIISMTKPSTTFSQLEMYNKFKMEFERRSKKVKRKATDEKTLTFADVADMEDVKKALKEAVELPMKYGELIKEFDLKPPKGLLLFGPPGTGKTYIVRAAAGEFGVPIIFLSGADLLKEGYGRAPEILKEAFNRAKDNAPALIFIDEIETVAPARGGSSNPLMGQLLQEMDGVKNLKNVLVIGATNLPQLLDPALLRPGRFDKIIYVPPPTEEVRAKIFEIHLGPFAEMFDLKAFAKRTEGFSAADIKALCEEIKMQLLQKKIHGEAVKLSNKEIDAIFSRRKPSITDELLYTYQRFLKEYGERK